MKPGDTAVVTANGARIDIELQPSSTWSFDFSMQGHVRCDDLCTGSDALTTGSLGGGGGGGGGTSGGGGGGSLADPRRWDISGSGPRYRKRGDRVAPEPRARRGCCSAGVGLAVLAGPFPEAAKPRPTVVGLQVVIFGLPPQ